MKLNYFTEQTIPKAAFGSHNKKPRIAFGKNGAIIINHVACTLIGLNKGDKISIAQDEEDPVNWYIFKDKSSGFEVRTMSDQKSCCFNHSGLCSLFREAMGLDDDITHSFFIAPEPTTWDKTKYFGILIPA